MMALLLSRSTNGRITKVAEERLMHRYRATSRYWPTLFESTMISPEDFIKTPTYTAITGAPAMKHADVVSPSIDPSTSSTSSNMINLTMRCKANTEFYVEDTEDICDRVQVMLTQESTTYKVGIINDDGSNNERSNPRRSIMVEWSFHLVDHFSLDREIVDVAFSYLDRFVDRCSTDDAAFKLACMTCLHIASKNIGPKYIPLKSLKSLSEGEFDFQHFIDMEMCVLRTLDWRVQPPTTRAFIELFLAFLPSNKVAMKQALSRRATFYSELSLFDYNCALETQSCLALSSILNAIKDIYPKSMSEVITRKFKGDTMFALDLGHENSKVTGSMHRLSMLYRDSEQYRLYEANKLHLLGMASEKFAGSRGRAFSKDSVSSEPNGSPVSVYAL